MLYESIVLHIIGMAILKISTCPKKVAEKREKQRPLFRWSKHRAAISEVLLNKSGIDWAGMLALVICGETIRENPKIRTRISRLGPLGLTQFEYYSISVSGLLERIHKITILNIQVELLKSLLKLLLLK